MADAVPPEKLPIGWTEQVSVKNGEEMKFYYNVITGQTRYSKADIPGYDKLRSSSQGTRQQTHVQNEDTPANKIMTVQAESNNNPDWLPQGWTVELNTTSKGAKYKRYIDPSTGRKFSSKLEILRYLNSDKGNEPASKQSATNIEPTKNPPVVEASGAETPQKPEEPTRKGTRGESSQKEKCSSDSRQKTVELVRCAVEGLPQGWIKEIKIERTGSKIRKDPYYTDPVSKYVFRSYPDAVRYVETKDPKVCAIKPRKREDLKFLSDDISISEETQSLDKTTEEGSEKKESNTPASVQPPTTAGSKRKRGRPVASPSTNNITHKPAEVITDTTKSEGEKLPSF